MKKAAKFNKVQIPEHIFTSPDTDQLLNSNHQPKEKQGILARFKVMLFQNMASSTFYPVPMLGTWNQQHGGIQTICFISCSHTSNRSKVAC